MYKAVFDDIIEFKIFPFDVKIFPFGAEIFPFGEKKSPFGKNKFLIAYDVSPFGGKFFLLEVMYFLLEILFFLLKRNISFWPEIFPFGGNIFPFGENESPFGYHICPFGGVEIVGGGDEKAISIRIPNFAFEEGRFRNERLPKRKKTMSALANDFKKFFSNSDSLKRLIIINVAVFFGLRILESFLALFTFPEGFYVGIVRHLMLPASVGKLLFQPWTLISYMFVHEDFMHILFNMLWLWVFGQIFLYYKGGKMLTTVYVLGGLSGGILYILAFNIFPYFANVVGESFALGASAGILAIVIATATYVPNYSIGIIFLGQVPLKYIAIFSVMSDAISITSSNAGGHIAHLGGAVFGYVYIKQIQQGKDMGKWFENILEWLKSVLKPKPKIRVVHKRPLTDEQFNEQKKARQDEIDRILDKIAKSGYDSLSKDEKETLFRASK